MKEQLYKYLSIGLLALLLLVCFGSLITYFVVGQESINVANAFDGTTGYYENNLLDNSDCSFWSYSITNSSVNDSTLISLGTYFSYYLVGMGTLTNSDFVNSDTTGNVFGLKIVRTSTAFPSLPYSYMTFACNVTNFGSNTLIVYSNGSTYNLSLSGTFHTITNNTLKSYIVNMVANDYLFIQFNDRMHHNFSWIQLQNQATNSYKGYVPNSYSQNGYNQGYTDGVNSASGGTSDIPLNLTNVSWRSPSTATVFDVNGVYDVIGSVSSSYTGSIFSFDVIQLVSGNTIFGEDGEYSPMYLINSSLGAGEGTIPVMSSELLTFTGGDDVGNTELIEWLQDNNGFLSYTDGYQDGYNDGRQIGYQEGYEQGNTDTIVTLDTTLQAFGSSVFTGVINQDPTTFWWSVQPGMQPNTAVYGYLCFNISSLPIGSIVHFNFPFQKYIIKDNSNAEHEITDIRVLYDVDYYTNLLIAPRDSLPSIRLEQGTETYSFNVIRPGDTIILYFPLNLVTDFNRYTFGLTWSGDEYNYSFTTSSISQDIKTQLDNAYERGLKDGNSQGYTNGYTVGYNEGADGAEHYTFNNLLGAVFDAPITMFLGKYNPQTRMREGGLFNFELLGVNLTGFVIALLSIGVVLFIMRLFIRGL